MPIFTKKTVRRGDMYSTLIDLAVNGGWEVTDLGTDGHIFHTMGSDGNTKMEFQLKPFPANGLNNTLYDIRTSGWANPTFYFIKNWNKVAKTYDRYNDYYPFALTFYRGGAPGTMSYHTQLDPNTMIDVWYLITKDVIVWVSVIPTWVSAANNNSFFIIGKPTENFLEEKTTGNFSGMVHLANSGTLINSASGVTSYSTPKNYLPIDALQTETSKVLDNFRTPDVDFQHALGDILYGSTLWGYRGRIKYFYTVANDGSIDGDIFTIDTPNGTEKYMKVSMYYGGSVWYHSVFPSAAYAIAIRIE